MLRRFLPPSLPTPPNARSTAACSTLVPVVRACAASAGVKPAPSHAATSVRVELALAGGGAQPAIRARAAAGGLVRIVVGGLRTAGGTLIGSPRHAAKGARLLARGRGILAASVGGGVHREYDH